MAKKTKRSRGTSKKKNRASASQRPLEGSVSTASSSTSTAEALQRDSSAPSSGPESGMRASAGILPPPREVGSDPSVDEISIPPVTAGQAPSELEDSFFVRRASVEKAAAAQARLEHEEEERELRRSLDPRSLQKMTAEAKARRAHLSRYVKWSVGAAAAIVALAMIRVGTRGKPVIDPPPPIIHTAMAATGPSEPQLHEIQGQPAGGNPAQAQPAQAEAPATQPAQPSQEQAQVQGEAVAQPALQNTAQPAPQPVQEAPVAAADPAPKPADPAPVAAAAAATDAPAKTAAQEKKDATRLLERGKTKDAIEAGERSVALDATDGEAWLILGAAYQQAGKNADARRCFTSCTKEGKHGPISECRAMLQ